MVQQFRARIITPSRVLLEWKPPSRPGVTKYKVSQPARIIHAHSSSAVRVRQSRQESARRTNTGSENADWILNNEIAQHGKRRSGKSISVSLIVGNPHPFQAKTASCDKN